MRTVLALNGGGIRGKRQTTVLRQLEHEVGRACRDVFSMIVGTSTGGIQALGLSLGTSAEHLDQFYDDWGSTIFSRRFLDRTFRLLPIYTSKYPNEGIDRATTAVFGKKRLSECPIPTIVAAWDITRNRPRYIKSYQDGHVLAKDAAMATSAAPTYFPLHTADDTTWWADGGLHSNDPSLPAYVEALKMWPSENIFVLNIGTGHCEDSLNVSSLQNGGYAQWGLHIIPLAMSGPMESQQHMLRVLTQVRGDEAISMDGPIEGSKSMDDASPANIKALAKSALQMIEDNPHKWGRIIQVLRSIGRIK